MTSVYDHVDHVHHAASDHVDPVSDCGGVHASAIAPDVTISMMMISILASGSGNGAIAPVSVICCGPFFGF